MVLDIYFGRFLGKSELRVFQKMAICIKRFWVIFGQFWLFRAHFGPRVSKMYLLQLFRCKENNEINKSGAISLFGNVDSPCAPKPTLGPKSPLKRPRRAKIGLNAPLVVQLIGFGPKKTNLSRSVLRCVPFTRNQPKEGRYQSHCFFEDSTGLHDSIGGVNGANQTTKESDNDGYKFRKDFFLNSKTRFFNIPLHVDICTLRKYLPPNTKLELEFHRSPDAFSLLSPFAADTCEILIEDMALSLTRYSPSPQIRSFYTNKLSSLKRQLLPIDRTLIKTYT